MSKSGVIQEWLSCSHLAKSGVCFCCCTSRGLSISLSVSRSVQVQQLEKLSLSPRDSSPSVSRVPSSVTSAASLRLSPATGSTLTGWRSSGNVYTPSKSPSPRKPSVIVVHREQILTLIIGPSTSNLPVNKSYCKLGFNRNHSCPNNYNNKFFYFIIISFSLCLWPWYGDVYILQPHSQTIPAIYCSS